MGVKILLKKWKQVVNKDIPVNIKGGHDRKVGSGASSVFLLSWDVSDSNGLTHIVTHNHDNFTYRTAALSN